MRGDRTGPVAGIILAAGASARMGRNKVLLHLQGESLLRRAARAAAAAGLDPVIVVTGHEAGPAIAELAGLPCRPVVNPDYGQGQATSIRAGLRAVPIEADAVVTLLADMPLVSGPMIATLVARFRHSGAPLVVSDYGGVQAPPTLYARSLFGELDALDRIGCAKRVVARHSERAAIVPWPPDALIDLDVPEDYERVRAMVGEEPRLES